MQLRRSPPVTESMFIAAQAMLAQDADTEIEDQAESRSRVSSSSSSPEYHSSQASSTEEVDDLDAQTTSNLRHPASALAAYAARAYLPDMPATVSKAINFVEDELYMRYPINENVTNPELIRSPLPHGEPEVLPTGGKRLLAEIEGICQDWLDRAAAKCKSSPVVCPRFGPLARGNGHLATLI